MPKLNIVLIFGSAPDVTEIRHWDLSLFKSCIAINNAWQVTPHWDYLIYPEDFPVEKHPQLPAVTHQKLITATEFVPHQNNYGGFIYAGGTMSFTAGYWALGELKPDIIAYLGCDMVYAADASQSSHFYGQGSADPLRNDITLQSLEAKSNRLMALANKQQCAVYNLSTLPTSRLTFPRKTLSGLLQLESQGDILLAQQQLLNLQKVNLALAAEEELGYWVPSGRYWESDQQFDPKLLRKIDDMWIESAAKSTKP
jgi:hypothetical protein